MTANSEVTASVSAIVREADEVVSLRLVPAAGDLFPAWRAGAHIDLVLEPGLVRQYSLCGDPGDRTSWRIAVLREPDGRGGSAFVHERLSVGDSVVCRGPRNSFALNEAPSYLFIAGGVGITPLIPMIALCEADGLPWRLIYGGRRGSSMAFQDELARHGDRVVFWPQETMGQLDLDTIISTSPPDAAIYCCGPAGLLEAVQNHASTRPPGSIHIERFRADTTTSGEGMDTRFEVFLEYSGLSITVDAGETLAEAIEDAGVDLETSCREGICGTCETKVIKGIPDHRDSYLSTDERASNTLIMPCCSRSCSSHLVLGL